MGEVVSVFLFLLQFPSYDVINDVIMSDADCTPGREPRSVTASCFAYLHFDFRLKLALSVVDSLLPVNNKMLLFYSTLI